MVMLVLDKDQNLLEYERKKENLIKHYLELTKSKQQTIRLNKDTSNLFRERKDSKQKLDVRDFNKVLYIDTENHVAEIEGMTTYEEIVKQTLSYGFLPTVVPELKSITIGGALAGCGIESSSFRYGLTHETMLEYDVLLGDGRVITCNPHNQYKDLYYAFPNTYGTLGYALKIKVKLIPVKKYIKLTHLHFNHPDEYFSEVEKQCLKNREEGSPIAYIDGTIFDKNNLYLTLGEFIETAPFVSNYQYMSIYYQSIQKKSTDYVTISDYIWRWDTDWFWCSKHFLMQNFLPRLLLGKWMLNSKTYWKWRHFFNKNKIANAISNKWLGKVESIIQDVEIPVQNASQFLEFFMNEIQITPIWMCPTKAYQKEMLYPFYQLNPNVLYINFGFWDMRESKQADGFYNKKIEKMVEQLAGKKSLYSRIYYTQDEFWNLYDKKLYDRLKQTYDPHSALANLYDKCHGRG